MKKIIEEILTQDIFLERPPVLIDIGASGEIHAAWEAIAKHSICIAFDADTRDFEVSEKANHGYKKIFLINRVVTADAKSEVDFYLTQSPYCSSSLEPDIERLQPWSFKNLFDIEKQTKMPSITLADALSLCNIEYVDWYKSDSQGTDLRLFDSLPPGIRNEIIAAEFEPGILDAYKQEDKLYSLMLYMDDLPFWVTDMRLRGTHRIDANDLARIAWFKRRFIRSFLRSPPGWCEIVYLNKLEKSPSERDLLLGWVIATIKKEHGFAMHLANQGTLISENHLFRAMYKSSGANLGGMHSYYKFAVSVVNAIFKRIFNKNVL